jgi:hypothetical protein
MLATAAIAAALFACTAAVAQEQKGPDISGKWATTTFGELTLKVTDRKDDKGVVVGKDVTGPYTSSNGKIAGDLQGATLTGHWMQPSSSVACKTKRGGTAYWGQLKFDFNEAGTEYKGVWGYCDEAPERGWSGQR